VDALVCGAFGDGDAIAKWINRPAISSTALMAAFAEARLTLPLSAQTGRDFSSLLFHRR
jgi:hypothetical protein